jgi:MoaA/NifB/PqqE/SkfB family radical SAM enzyme
MKSSQLIQYKQDVTILWALRSQCNMACIYCYFNSVRRNKQTELNEFSLFSDNTNTLSYVDMKEFIDSINVGLIKRVFLAGGEPLAWEHIFDIVRGLKNKKIEVVICTNGITLNDENICKRLIDEGVDALSISIDSINEKYNDYWRPAKNGKGLNSILVGLNTLLAMKIKNNSKLKIGIYSVITKKNISHIEETFQYFEQLVDYFVIQPITLVKDDILYPKLALGKEEINSLERIFKNLKRYDVIIPKEEYFKLWIKILKNDFCKEEFCSAGDKFFFIQPSGIVLDCPSNTKQKCISIKNNDVVNFILKSNINMSKKCKNISIDCLNMWQLMSFNDILKVN